MRSLPLGALPSTQWWHTWFNLRFLIWERELCFYISFSSWQAAFSAFQGVLIVLSASWAGVSRDALALEGKEGWWAPVCLLHFAHLAECVRKMRCRIKGSLGTVISNTWRGFRADQHHLSCHYSHDTLHMAACPATSHTHQRASAGFGLFHLCCSFHCWKGVGVEPLQAAEVNIKNFSFCWCDLNDTFTSVTLSIGSSTSNYIHCYCCEFY